MKHEHGRVTLPQPTAEELARCLALAKQIRALRQRTTQAPGRAALPLTDLAIARRFPAVPVVAPHDAEGLRRQLDAALGGDVPTLDHDQMADYEAQCYGSCHQPQAAHADAFWPDVVTFCMLVVRRSN